MYTLIHHPRSLYVSLIVDFFSLQKIYSPFFTLDTFLRTLL